MAIGVKAKNSSRAKNRVIGIIVALGLIVFVCIMTFIASAETKKTITVVRVKSDASIPANALITEDKVEPYDMYYKEFEKYGTMEFSDGKRRSTIVRWEDRDALVGKRYAAYYLRNNTLVFWDSTLADQTRKNSYLYSMNGELLNIQMNTVKDFGDMVVPGDSLNIRASYQKTLYNLPSEEEYQLQQSNGNTSSEGLKVDVVEPLFSEVKVLDMLNGSGNSIFDIYYEYIAMTKEQQAAALQDNNFLQSVTPASILLEVTSEEVEHYMEVQAKGAQYQITLLPRDGSSSITDSLSDIQEALAGIAGFNN
jgi:hypothetical protein